MILRLIGYELASLARDTRARIAVIAFALLMLVALASSAVTSLRADADRSAIAAAERARWVGQGTKDPHSAAHYSIYAFKPAPALAALDNGVEPFVGQALWLEAHSRHDALHRPFQDASPLQRAGLVTPASLLFGFALLIVFLLAFSAVAQDRERGTLRLALGAAAHPGRILWAKAAAICGAATALLVVPVSVTALVVTSAAGTIDGDVIARLLGWTLLGASYLALLSAIGVVVALRAPSARVALALMFGAWLLFALALPRAASSAVERLHPLPSTQSVKQTLLDEAPVFWSDDVSRKYEAELLRRYKVTRKEDLPVDARGAELDLAERHSHEVIDRVLGGFYGRVVGQDRLFALFGFLSPTIAAQSLSPAIAGSDFTHHRAFLDDAEGYRRRLVERMNADVIATPLNQGGPRHTNDASLWAKVPEFRHVAPLLSAGAATAAPALGALILWLAAAGALLGWAAKRVRP